MAQGAGTGGGPELVVETVELAGIDESPGRMRGIPGSRMFEIREALRTFEEHHPGTPVYDASQGDGGASLPGVPEAVLEEAHRLQVEHGTGYDRPYGTELFRRAVVEEYWGLDAATGWGPENVIACQGGRDALAKAYEAVQFLGHGRRGDFVVVSRVPWISYNWGPYGLGANVMLAPGEEDRAWQLTPQGIRECIGFAEGLEGRRVALLVITSPDNPTGRTISLARQVELARAALGSGVPFVLFDWIYHRVTDGASHDLNEFMAMLDAGERDRCLVLDGVTKSLGASNIRNAHLFASREVIRFMSSRASHTVIPSFHSQAVAVAAYRMGFEAAARGIIEPTNASRRLLISFLEGRGIRYVVGQGYYAFLDVGPWLDRAGMRDSAELGTYLAEEYGLAVVPGVYFSRFAARWIRFSYALPPESTSRAAERLWSALEAL